MGLAGYVASYAALGFGMRCYQNALMIRSMFHGPSMHILLSTLGGGAGYYMYNVKQNNNKLLEERRERLLQRKAEREARLAA
jgi:hypothetical protein